MKSSNIEFKSGANVAQPVERLIRNEQVGGSSPFVGSRCALSGRIIIGGERNGSI